MDATSLRRGRADAHRLGLVGQLAEVVSEQGVVPGRDDFVAVVTDEHAHADWLPSTADAIAYLHHRWSKTEQLNC